MTTGKKTMDTASKEYQDKMNEAAKNLRGNLQTHFSPDGEMLVEVDKETGLVIREVGLPILAYVEKEISFALKEDMGKLYDHAIAIRKTVRQIPTLKIEALDELHISKSHLRKLQGKGLVLERTGKINDARNPYAKIWKTFVYFTPQGRAFVRHHFDPEYGLNLKNKLPKT